MEFYKLSVKQIVRETADAITIYFEHPPGKKIEYKPGQFLTLIIKEKGEEIRRAYSLCTSPYLDNYLGVTVKRVMGGKVSNILNESLRAGDVLDVMEPLGNFTTIFNGANQRHLVLFGGGSGITPLMSIIKTALSREPKTQISLIYANRDANAIIFKDALEKLGAEHPQNFRIVNVVDTPPAGWAGHTGLLNPPLIKNILNNLPSSIKETEYFICGPEAMMEVIVDTLLSLNISKEVIHKESFDSQSAKEAANKTEEELEEEGIIAREVKVIYDGEEHKFIVPPNKTILETALDLDIDLPYSCQSGLCTACRGKCISGKVKMDEEDGLSESERKDGYVLTCVGHPLTKNVVIEIG